MPRRKTCKRFDEPGHAHAWTFSCYRRQPFLTKDRSRNWLIEAMERARDEHGVHIWAYVIMPEHAHVLFWPPVPECKVSGVFKAIKLSVARKAVVFVRRHAPWFLPRMEHRRPNGKISHRFWQRGGGYDRNLFEPRAIFSHIEYIHANPVRRGLCLRPEDWHWSSAADYARIQTGPLRIDFESLPTFVNL